ncbi:MAG TPA: RDD family protein [Polyangia bacterium]
MSAPEPPNPYAPPAARLDADAGAGPAPAGPADLASRWQRLGGALFDAMLATIALAPAFFGLSFREFTRARRESANPFLIYQLAGTWGLIAAGLAVGLAVLQWTLLTTRGQTVGKMVAGTRVVSVVDGAPVGFLHAVALRSWPTEILGRLPLLQLLTLVDVLCIFGERRRCLHDAIAGTVVVNARPLA